MNGIRIHWLATGLLPLMVWGQAGPADTLRIAFQQLEPGQCLRVRFSSGGCFHSYSYELEFQRSDRVQARIATRTDDPDDPPMPGPWKVMGRSELKRLDRLLEFYREIQRHGCTTVDHIQLELSDERGMIAQEYYKDGTCHNEEVKGVLTLDQVHRILGP